MLRDWQKVLDDPTATDKFILGHTHLRWSSFLKSSPVAAILKSEAKVFIAQGLDDSNSLPASADVLYAELMARGRSCHYQRIEGGDHAFMTAGDNGEGLGSHQQERRRVVSQCTRVRAVRSLGPSQFASDAGRCSRRCDVWQAAIKRDSKRSKFMTLSQAATKSCRKAAWDPSHA